MSDCMGRQAIHCDVTKCAFNEDSCRCGLDAIDVCNCHDDGTGRKEDQSMCASFQQR